LKRRQPNESNLLDFLRRKTEDMYREAQAVGLLPTGTPPEHDTALAALRAINPVIRELPVHQID